MPRNFRRGRRSWQLCRMECKQCRSESKEWEKIHPTGSRRTMMGVERFWDKQGDYHVHDRNTVTRGFRCSEGHRWESKSKDGLCWCGWGAVAISANGKGIAEEAHAVQHAKEEE